MLNYATFQSSFRFFFLTFFFLNHYLCNFISYYSQFFACIFVKHIVLPYCVKCAKNKLALPPSGQWRGRVRGRNQQTQFLCRCCYTDHNIESTNMATSLLRIGRLGSLKVSHFLNFKNNLMWLASTF